MDFVPINRDIFESCRYLKLAGVECLANFYCYYYDQCEKSGDRVSALIAARIAGCRSGTPRDFAVWYVLAVVAYLAIGFETKGRTIEELDAALARSRTAGVGDWPG